ncbi:MAG: AbrB/MazE/SpoVT family DNA-binding domain-containing protein [Planctomycetota bacterium]
MEHSTVTSKGQTTLPVELRNRHNIKAGDRLLFDDSSGEIVLRKHPGVDEVAGMLRDKIKLPIASHEEERAAAARAWARDGRRGAESD